MSGQDGGDCYHTHIDIHRIYSKELYIMLNINISNIGLHVIVVRIIDYNFLIIQEGQILTK